MTEEQTPIIIVIPEEEEIPFVPERPGSDVQGKTSKIGKRVTETAGMTIKKAKQSKVWEKTTRSLKRGANSIMTKGGRFVGDKIAEVTERQAREKATAVRTRIQSVDWKQEAKTGTAKGLRWLSNSLSKMAERFTPVEQGSPEKTPEQTNE